MIVDARCVYPVRRWTPTYIGKLRTILHSLGRDCEWDRRFGLGNPAADKSVKDYLRLVSAEQLQARVTPKQATTFFVDKLTQLCSHLDRKLQDNKAIDRHTLRWLSFVAIAQGDLRQVKVLEILRFPTALTNIRFHTLAEQESE